MQNTYDVIVIGCTAGGIAAALRARNRGLRTALIDEGRDALDVHEHALHVLAHAARHRAYAHEVGALGGDLDRYFHHARARIVEGHHVHDTDALRARGVDIVRGAARLIRPSIFAPSHGAVAIAGDDAPLYAEHIVIAVHGRARQLGTTPCDGVVVCTDVHMVQRTQLPESLVIVGAGARGVAWASIMTDFGVAVTLIEQEPRILHDIDEHIAAEVQAQLVRRGVRVETMRTVTHCDAHGVVYCGAHEAVAQAPCVLITIGVAADVAHLGLEHTRVVVDGHVVVNAHMQTHERHMYAIGASVGTGSSVQAMVYQADVAIDALCGMHERSWDRDVVPTCVVGRPEVASIGVTAEGARAQGRDVDVVVVRGTQVAKARIIGDDDALIRVVIDRATRMIVGVHMASAHATEMIAAASLAMLVEATAWEIGMAAYAHPTLAQAWYVAGRTLDWDVPR